MNKYNSFLVIMQSSYSRQFGFFVPNKFEYTNNLIYTKKQLAFYSINNLSLVTVINSLIPAFKSNDEHFVWINWGVWIYHDRSKLDETKLCDNFWKGIR